MKKKETNNIKYKTKQEMSYYLYMTGSEYTILHQLFKLGCTEQPVERMYQYNTGDPPGIGLEKQYIGIWEISVDNTKEMKTKESEMHRHFQEFRKKRGDSFTEWFSCRWIFAHSLFS